MAFLAIGLLLFGLLTTLGFTVWALRGGEDYPEWTDKQ